MHLCIYIGHEEYPVVRCGNILLAMIFQKVTHCGCLGYVKRVSYFATGHKIRNAVLLLGIIIKKCALRYDTYKFEFLFMESSFCRKYLSNIVHKFSVRSSDWGGHFDNI